MEKGLKRSCLAFGRPYEGIARKQTKLGTLEKRAL
jgi:hypothetical protein